MHYDVFNGDADGIFALHQYRLFFPAKNRTLVTGAKRDIKLLENIEGENLQITVFDISLDANRTTLLKLLKKNNHITWFDHHFAGEIPSNSLLKATIKTTAEHCTSSIVSDKLKNRFALWAICGAFGDNLHAVAQKRASLMQLKKKELTLLAELGELFNYNGYGASQQDLHFHPASLYQAIEPYQSPFEFIEDTEIIPQLRAGYNSDMIRAEDTARLHIVGNNRIYIFPDTPWARRVSGVFANLKAREQQHAAHAVITEKEGFLQVSVRAPLNSPRDADTLCKSFATGGGRAAAAGINVLAKNELDGFCRAFSTTYSSQTRES